MTSANSPLPKILVVEDDPAIAKAIRLNLQRLEVEVKVAVDGAEAISVMNADPPDLICLDLMLPDVSGYQVLSHLRANATLQHIPVVVMSARALPEDRARAIELGASAYLVKPFLQATLRQKVSALLESLRVAKVAP